MASSHRALIVSAAALALAIAACEPTEVREARHRKAAAEGRAAAEHELREQDEAIRRSVEAQRQADAADADVALTDRLVARARATLADPTGAHFERYVLNTGRTAVCGLVSVRDDAGRYGSPMFFMSTLQGEVAVASGKEPLTDADVRLMRMQSELGCTPR
jgi:hypothetical protein